MIRRYISKLLGQIVYCIGQIFLEFACISFWASGYFLHTKIDTLHETTWDYDKYVVTLLKDKDGDCR